jgi:PEP-CTERM motif
LAAYDALYLQLNFERIWVPWLAPDQQLIQMWLHTDPYADSLAWNDVGSVQRTVTDAVPEPSTWAMMLIGFAGLGFVAYRRQKKTAFTTDAMIRGQSGEIRFDWRAEGLVCEVTIPGSLSLPQNSAKSDQR